MMRRFALVLATGLLCVPVVSARAVADNPPLKVEVNPLHTDPGLLSDPEGAMRAARERVAAGDLDGAIRGLATYVAGHLGEIPPERLLGDLYYRRGDLKRAEDTYKHILQFAPLDKETHNRLGSVYATENRIDAAIYEFNHSLPGTDSVPDLVRLHMRKGDFAKYERERIYAATSYPTDAEAQLELGEVYAGTRRYAEAELYYKRALDDNPTLTLAMNRLGLVYLDEDRYAEAMEQFNACLQKDAYDYACADNLGATYLESKEYGRAAAILAFAHNLQPEASEALVNLGYLSDVNGDWKKAVSYYVQAMTVYPYAPDAYIDLGYTYDQHNLYPLAQSALIKGLAVAPDDGRLHFLLGDVYARQGNVSQAEEQFKLAAASDDPDVKRIAQERVASLGRPTPKP